AYVSGPGVVDGPRRPLVWPLPAGDRAERGRAVAADGRVEELPGRAQGSGEVAPEDRPHVLDEDAAEREVLGVGSPVRDLQGLPPADQAEQGREAEELRRVAGIRDRRPGVA